MRFILVTATAALAASIPAAQPARSPENNAAKAILPDAQQLQAPAVAGPVSETLTGSDMTDQTLWKPGIYFDPVVDDFMSDIIRLDRRDATSKSAVSARYGLSVPALDATLAFIREMTKDAYDRGRQPQLREDALNLVQLSNRAPIALILAAGALEQFANNGCTETDVAQLMDGSRNPDHDLWEIATTCLSASIVGVALERDIAARPALLYLGLDWTLGDPDFELAAADMLLRPDYLALVDEKQRDAIRADIASSKLAKLLHVGLFSEALAFGDSLPAEIRDRALRGRRAGIRTSIGGFALQVQGQATSPVIEYAAALALAGRNAEARSALDMVAPGAKLRSVRACLDAEIEQDCGVGDFGRGKVPLSALIVDQLLVEPSADPYVLMEQAARGSPSVDGAAISEALCRLLTQGDEPRACKDLRKGEARDRAGGRDGIQSDRALWAAMERVGGRAFEAAKASYGAKLAALGQDLSPTTERVSVDPAPVPFPELPIPAARLANHPLPGIDAKSLARLSEGFTFVRAERSGKHVAAISLSQRFDPDGEVTAGGYWIHLSDDGGKTWQAPLYTGLAEHFPYVVPSSSRLPMIDGDRIHLEVEESLIDTATIGYPPVGTRIRRKRSGIYLDIPIADLRQDSDGDGITDIAARHLLLGGDSRAKEPFIVGRDRNCSTPPSAETLARLAVLRTLFKVEARALIEPVGGKSLLIGGWRKSEPTDKPPIFMRGDPNDYRCVSIDRLMVVYPDADREELRKFSPDFQLIDLPAIYWNRDHTRGFLKWNMGWTGGTYRLVREADGWKLETISSWIT